MAFLHADDSLYVLFVYYTGSDYCDKLKGIGVLKACNIVREAFYTEPDKSPLEKVLERVFQETYDKSNLSPNDKETYKANFLKALLMFRHPVVYDPFLAKCVTVGDPDDLENGDVELLQYKPYAELVRDASRREEVVGKLLDPPIATMIAEGWISARSKRPYIETEKLPKYVRDYVEQVQLERHARAGQVSNVVVLDGEEGQPVESDKATNERQALESDPQEMQTQPVATVQVVETRTVTQVRIHLTTEDATVPVDGQGSQESVGEMDATELQTQAFSTGHETQPTQEGQSTTNKFSYTEEEEEEVEGVEESKRDEDAVLGGEARLEAQPPSSKRTSPERRTDGGKSEDQVSKRARLEDDTTGKVDTEQRNERLPIPLQMGEESQASQDDASSELGEDEPILCTQAF